MSEKTKKVLLIALAVFVVLAGAFSRLLPHPANFTPLVAIALFGGFYLPVKIAVFLPLSAMFVSDIFVGLYDAKLMIAVYFSLALLVVFGGILRSKNFFLKKIWQKTIFGALFGSVLFFLLTNFAVWAFMGWYPLTVSGLWQCYLSALPFFKNALLGDMIFTSAFFASYSVVALWFKSQSALAIKQN